MPGTECSTDCQLTYYGLETSNVKMTSFFRDQVSCVSDWFVSWNECEQVVTLYSLLRKITSTQARFLAQVLEHILQNCTDSDAQESYANDPAYISSLCKESKEFAVSQLLKCLPLLKVGNTKAKAEYLNIMPMVMAHSIENNCHIEECRQLLSYSLIHPAISRDELAVLTIWMNSLEECHSLSNTKTTKPMSVPPSLQNLLVPQYTTGSSGDGPGNAPMISVQDKSSVHSVPNGIATRYLMGSVTEQTSSGCDWPTMTVPSSVGGGRTSTDLGTMSNCDQVHTGAIGTRNRTLTSSASVPLSDGLNHPFISWSLGGQAPAQHLSSPSAYTALQNHQVCVRKSEGHQKLARTASLVPQPNATTPSVSDWLSHVHSEQTDGATTSSSTSRLNTLFINPDQLHAPLSPQSSITSSGSGGSDTLHDDLHRTRSAPMRDDTAMKDVSVWLKSLRLHKYSHLFQQITYDEMMNLTEEWLEGQGVTKGARNKIIISIRKLKDRQDALKAIEKDVMGNGNLKQAITDLRQLLNAPIKQYTPDGASTTVSSSSSSSMPSTSSSCSTAGPGKDNGVRNSYGSSQSQESSFSADGGSNVAGPSYDQMSATSEADSITEGDIPGQMTRVLGKICTQLLVRIRPDCDCLINYQQLLDRCINHHAFTDEQKKKMVSWRQQIHRVWQFLLQKQNVDHHRPSFSSGVQTNVLLRGSHRPVRRPTTGPSWTFGGAGGSSSWSVQSGPPQLGGHPVLTPQASAPQCPNPSSFASGFSSRPIEVSPVKQPLSRTQSAPIKSAPLTIPMVSAPVAETPENNSTNDDIHASLDSLCISMMEHALGN